MSKRFRLLAIPLILAVILAATVGGVAFAAGGGQGACWSESSDGEGDDPDVCLENRWGQPNDVAFAAGGPNSGDCPNPDCPRDGDGLKSQNGYGPRYQYRLGQG